MAWHAYPQTFTCFGKLMNVRVYSTWNVLNVVWIWLHELSDNFGIWGVCLPLGWIWRVNYNFQRIVPEMIELRWRHIQRCALRTRLNPVCSYVFNVSHQLHNCVMTYMEGDQRLVSRNILCTSVSSIKLSLGTPLYAGLVFGRLIKNETPKYFNHLPLKPYICVCLLGHHWFRQWLGAYSGHYLNKYWVMANWTLKYKLQWNLDKNTELCIDENTSENTLCGMFCPVVRGGGGGGGGG